MAMPERICRSAPVPSSRVKRRSLLDFFTFSQAFTFTARKSHLQKVSKSTGSVSWGSTSMAGRAARLAASAASSSSWRAFSASTRGNRFSPLVTAAVSLRPPQAATLSQVRRSAPAPIWPKSFSMLSGMKGVRSTPQIRVASSRL